MAFYERPSPADAVPIRFVTQESWSEIKAALPAPAAHFAASSKFEPTPGQHLVIPDAEGRLGHVLFGLEGKSTPHRDAFLPGKLTAVLPPAVYRFANAPHDTALAVLAWALASYRFDKYKKKKQHDQAQLVPPADIDLARIKTLAAGVTLGRDLINTPANDLDPDALEAAAVMLAAQFGAEAAITLGDALREENFPLIHAVGRAAAKAPRLVDFSWGPEAAPKVTLVGKGVCFDTGGLDIKPSSGMILMKKDMGGAATALALAHFIMDRGLPVRLRVLLPIVENAISASAMRPSDIYPSRKGLSVEVGNTDAEGRLILADALALADEEAPDLLFDFATLTGAARVALGPDLPPFYTQDDRLAAEIEKSAKAANDPVWRLPLWAPYDKLIDSKLADVNNSGNSSFAGSITAALFLKRFVEKSKSWTHFDLYAWTPNAKPARPEGGEIQVARLLFDLLEARYGAHA
ncbi:M17 family metallopeptidase [uncultured Methylovirgula sp.]|uniref:leucyl aminopeptidase family protein n=1 Tax=uncultured Methylovirgula sp. TaxID=1285960 RepID=UPI0026204E5C|nr:leucyl aminopeptidase family protein [uncultured Methylovirgula sp.]